MEAMWAIGPPPVAIVKFIVIAENKLDEVIIEDTASPALKMEEWVSLLKS